MPSTNYQDFTGQIVTFHAQNRNARPSYRPNAINAVIEFGREVYTRGAI